MQHCNLQALKQCNRHCNQMTYMRHFHLLRIGYQRYSYNGKSQRHYNQRLRPNHKLWLCQMGNALLEDLYRHR